MYLLDVLLLGREAEFPTLPGETEEETVMKMWSSAGKSAFGGGEMDGPAIATTS